MKNEYYWDFGCNQDGPIITVENGTEVLAYFEEHSELSIAKAIALVADLTTGRITPKAAKCLIT